MSPEDGVEPASREVGELWVCGTPIGNLQDASSRLLEVLRQADLVAAEDTRRTLKLLTHFEIRRRLVSFHEHNARRRAPALVRRMLAGETVALVTDAGMPGISDPGPALVALAAQQGVPVRVVPGPSAVVAALAVSGLPAQPFWFEGFLPRKASERDRRLEMLRGLDATLVFFEAPHRLKLTLRALAEVLGPRPAACARELTKVHEEVWRGPLDALAARAAELDRPPQGEFTLVVGPPPVQKHPVYM